MTSSPAQRRAELLGLLGELPDRDRPIAVETVHEEEFPNYIMEKLVLDVNGLEAAPAFLVKPKTGKAPFPAILYNHSHGGNYHLGKQELLFGADHIFNPSYAEALTEAGYVALSIDHWAFGGRSTRTESEIFKEMLWRGQVMWGMMVYDSIRAVDYLQSRQDVDADRIGTLGMSMGSTMAWWVAALDERVKVCADICCLTDFESIIKTGWMDRHGIYYFVPGLLNHFSAAQINALIAPRPHIGVAGDLDTLTPPDGLDKIDRELKQVYASLGAEDAWELHRYDVEHIETADMRKRIMAFLDRWM